MCQFTPYVNLAVMQSLTAGEMSCQVKKSP